MLRRKLHQRRYHRWSLRDPHSMSRSYWDTKSLWISEALRWSPFNWPTAMRGAQREFSFSRTPMEHGAERAQKTEMCNKANGYWYGRHVSQPHPPNGWLNKRQTRYGTMLLTRRHHLKIQRTSSLSSFRGSHNLPSIPSLFITLNCRNTEAH